MNDLYNFEGKTVLITGASSGLGEQFARVLSKAGARVILLARRMDKLEKLSEELGDALPLEMDVSNRDSVESVFNELERLGEKVDVCINNAGIVTKTPVLEDNRDAFESVIQTNLMGVWYVTQMAAQHMKQHNIHGSIINIGSIRVNVPAVGSSAYSVSKAAVAQLTKALVGELSPYKIRINCISPGRFKTPIQGDAANRPVNTPYGEMAEPSDLDGLILYLASNKASRFVTGSCFTIDGGESWGGKVQ